MGLIIAIRHLIPLDLNVIETQLFILVKSPIVHRYLHVRIRVRCIQILYVRIRQRIVQNYRERPLSTLDLRKLQIIT